MKIVTMLNGVISPGAEGVKRSGSLSASININNLKSISIKLDYNDNILDVLIIKVIHDKPGYTFYALANKKSEVFNKDRLSNSNSSKNDIICALRQGGKLKIIEKSSSNKKSVLILSWDGKLLTSRGKSQIAKSINVAKLIEEGELEHC